MNITVAGLGHVGLVCATALAAIGHDVIGIDSDKSRVGSLNGGIIPFHEPGLAEEMNRQVHAGRLYFTSDPPLAYGSARIVFLTVGTPPLLSGGADLTAVMDAADSISCHAYPGTVVVEKSTVPPGTYRELEKQLFGTDLHVVSNPEFLREGTALADTMNPMRIVVGASSNYAADIMRRCYQNMIDSGTPYYQTNVATAELSKHASNSFLATKISFINRIASLCEKTGADVSDVADIMGADPRIGRAFLDAGLGFGGFCFPKDVSALSKTFWDHNLPVPGMMLDDVLEINRSMIQLAADKLEDLLSSPLEGKSIVVLGLAFKPDTDDTRESPAVNLVVELQRRRATVSVWDPEVAPVPFSQAGPLSDIYETCAGSDAVVIATEWDEVHAIDFDRLREVMAGHIILDARNALTDDELDRAAQADLYVAGVGR